MDVAARRPVGCPLFPAGGIDEGQRHHVVTSGGRARAAPAAASLPAAPGRPGVGAPRRKPLAAAAGSLAEPRVHDAAPDDPSGRGAALAEELILTFEALPARSGDALLVELGTRSEPRLLVVDGGPPDVFASALSPRLEAIRRRRGLPEGQPLDIDLALVSHLDTDHFGGLLELVRGLDPAASAPGPATWRIHRFWLNGFDELLGNVDPAVGTRQSLFGPAAIDSLLDHAGSMLLQSVPAARELRRRVHDLGLGGDAAGGWTRAGPRPPLELGEAKVHVISPLVQDVAALRRDWRDRVRPLLGQEPNRERLAELAAFLQKRLLGLASLVVLIEADGKRLLLTGDARSEQILAGLEAGGFLDESGGIELELLKLPCHGSERHVDREFFQRVRARHYVVSADGRHDLPAVRTLASLSEARKDDLYDLEFALSPDAFAVSTIGKATSMFLARERLTGRRYGWNFGSRKGGEKS